MQSYYFTEAHEQFRQSLRAFYAKEVIPHIDDWEKAGEIPKSIWKKMGDLGFLGLNHPAQYGGQEADFFFTVVFQEETVRVNSGGFGAAVGVTPYMAGAHILAAGSDYLKDKYLPGSIAGELLGALAITEPNAGSDVANIRTTARREGDFYYVNGSKTFITNGVLSDYIVTAVKTNPEAGAGGISLLVIDRDMPGVRATKLNKLGWHASDTGEIAFDNVKVPVDHLVGGENRGFYYIMDRFQLERLIMAIGGVASAEFALEYALQYMNERQAFGRKIKQFQALRHRVADLASEITRAKYFNYYLAQMHQDGKFVVKECSMAKLLGTELADQAMYKCLQFFGGYGFIEDYKIARMFRDSRIGTIGGGSSEIMREIIAKMVIDSVQYRSPYPPTVPASH
ncbi:MAG: acyl-CoA dehydrogenase family protein [Microscillaceae bacterium]